MICWWEHMASLREVTQQRRATWNSLSLGLCPVSTASLVGADKSYNLMEPYPKSSFWCDRIAFTYNICLLCHDWDVFLQVSTYRTYPWWILDNFAAMWELVPLSWQRFPNPASKYVIGGPTAATDEVTTTRLMLASPKLPPDIHPTCPS